MNTFEKLREHHIPTLQATVEEYVSPSTGARHIHLSTNQADLAFLVAFPTVPDKSDGCAHILEHLALCGSQRYPVRDPFFAMLRRSTATFMNAMTYADRTAYPFASTDRNDFFNLLDVYLDATFFPRLDYLSFCQEGWRHSIKEGNLSYQGVVFNEMKGAFADPSQALHSGVTQALLTGTTYAVIAGGDPLSIPDLSHEALKAFHATHYHPSQAVFMSAGPISADDIQERINTHVLARLPGYRERLMPQLATVTEPRHAQILVPSQTGEEDEYGIQFAWILGESSDATAYYHANLLEAGLLGDASAPVRKAMESASYGRPSRLNGMDSGARQLLFHVGMEGLTEPQSALARDRILAALQQAATEGVPIATLRAVLRDIKYDQRDTSSGNMPNVLMRMLNALPVAMRGGDIVDAFDSKAAMEQLEHDITVPGFFQGLVRNLIESQSRLDALIVPDAHYFSARAEAEKARLATTLATLTELDKKRIVDETNALEAQQRQPSDSYLLPRIAPSEVSLQPRPIPTVPTPVDGAYLFEIPSNGLSYARVQFDARAVSQSDWPWLRLYVDLRRDLGVADHGYEDADVWRSTLVPSFLVDLEATQDLAGVLRPTVVFFASGLQEGFVDIATVLCTYIDEPRFDEYERIAFLVQRMIRDRVQNLGQDGNRLASLAATAPLSELRRFEDITSGVASLTFVAELSHLLATDSGIAQIAQRLDSIHAQINSFPRSLLCAGSGDVGALGKALVDGLRPMSIQAASNDHHFITSTGSAATRSMLANAALHSPGQVNHCVAAWQSPPMNHAHAPALAVAAELISNQLLHPALRERGGAYGGAASYSIDTGVFSMSSFRDPRLAETYIDFANAVDQLLSHTFSIEQIEEAIICVIKGLDRPTAPFDGAVTAWQLDQRGVDHRLRARFRSGVLACTQDDIRAAIESSIKEILPSRAAYAGNLNQDLAGLTPVDLLKLATNS